MQYYVTPNNIHIYDSWIYSKFGFQDRLELIEQEHPECQVFYYRSYWHMKMEWATHSFLYNLGYKPDETSNVDLNYPQKWYVKVLYALTGPLAWVFIR